MSKPAGHSPDSAANAAGWRRIYWSVLLFFILVLAGLQAFSSYLTPS